ncbi:MAG: AAA family ATPase [Nanoarchaeota archaeon]|nr:AAA family ATPase [Nanoarchaeota archaeon]
MLTGGSGSGKSSIILALEQQGEFVIREAAEDYIKTASKVKYEQISQIEQLSSTEKTETRRRKKKNEKQVNKGRGSNSNLKGTDFTLS